MIEIPCTSPSSPAIPEEELAAIAQYARRPLAESEVYPFRIVLCDNDLDRDCECFTAESLQKLSALFIGKTGIFDHDPRGEKQTARIYKTWVEAEEGRHNFLGEPYLALHAAAYMVRTSANADLILEIDAGIKKEVSVGCAVARSTCSVCGADRNEAPCLHHPGRRYGKALCFTRLEQPTDAYEWSFVAVPSQPAAGVTKSHGGTARAKSLTPARALQEMQQGELHLDAPSSLSLHAHIMALQQAGEDARVYRETLVSEVRALTLSARPELSPALLEKTLAPLATAELLQLRDAAQKQFDRRFPPLVQTAPPAGAAAFPAIEHYKI